MNNANTVQVNGLLVAMEMERRGRMIYIRAQQFTENRDLLALLEQLASEEEVHFTQFATMLEECGLTFLDAEEHALAVSKAADYFFQGGLMQAALDGALKSPVSMLTEAMKAESDSIAFYTRLRDSMDDPAQKEIIQRIIAEEENHLSTLEKRKLEY